MFCFVFHAPDSGLHQPVAGVCGAWGQRHRGARSAQCVLGSAAYVQQDFAGQSVRWCVWYVNDWLVDWFIYCLTYSYLDSHLDWTLESYLCLDLDSCLGSDSDLNPCYILDSCLGSESELNSCYIIFGIIFSIRLGAVYRNPPTLPSPRGRPQITPVLRMPSLLETPLRTAAWAPKYQMHDPDAQFVVGHQGLGEGRKRSRGCWEAGASPHAQERGQSTGGGVVKSTTRKASGFMTCLQIDYADRLYRSTMLIDDTDICRSYFTRFDRTIDWLIIIVDLTLVADLSPQHPVVTKHSKIDVFITTNRWSVTCVFVLNFEMHGIISYYRPISFRRWPTPCRRGGITFSQTRRGTTR